MSAWAAAAGLDVPDAAQLVRVTVRLVLSALLGGVLGWERERVGQAAGLRTHMLVCLGSALFVVSMEEAGASAADMTRVVQGIATGIGFVGAGAILKEGGQVRGLTTASGIWLTAAIGMAVGMGRLWLPVLGAALAWVILAWLRGYERRLGARGDS